MKILYIWYNLRNSLTLDALKLIYNSLIYPNLIYCNSVWGSCSAVYSNPLNIIQKKLLRIMLFKKHREHTAPLFKIMNMLPLHQIHFYMCILFVYKSIFNNSNSFFSQYVGNYNTRLSTMSVPAIPNITSSHSRQSIRWVGTRLWNDLPLEFRDGEISYDSFKFRLKRLLLTQL